MNFIIKLVLSSIAILITSYLLPGVDVEDFFSALIVAALLALLNITVRPLLILFTIPITVFTLGLFLLVINALMILIADSIVPGFYVDGFWWALLFSIVLALFTSMLEALTKDHDRKRR